ncbi:7213_t:CDS:2, partial [Ambispora gerdemannii]
SKLSNEGFATNLVDKALILQHGFRSQKDSDNSDDSDGSPDKIEQFESLVDESLTLFHKKINQIELEDIGALLKTYYDNNVQFPSEFKVYLKTLQYFKYKTFMGFLYQTGVILEQDYLMAYKIYKESEVERPEKLVELLKEDGLL